MAEFKNLEKIRVEDGLRRRYLINLREAVIKGDSDSGFCVKLKINAKGELKSPKSRKINLLTIELVEFDGIYTRKFAIIQNQVYNLRNLSSEVDLTDLAAKKFFS